MSILVLLTLLAAFWAHASEPTRGDDWAIERWTPADGLPLSHLTGVAQTPDGMLWLSTLDGLLRFDGARFVTLRPTGQGALVRLREGGSMVSSSTTESIWENAFPQGKTGTAVVNGDPDLPVEIVADDVLSASLEDQDVAIPCAVTDMGGGIAYDTARTSQRRPGPSRSPSRRPRSSPSPSASETTRASRTAWSRSSRRPRRRRPPPPRTPPARRSSTRSRPRRATMCRNSTPRSLSTGQRS